MLLSTKDNVEKNIYSVDLNSILKKCNEKLDIDLNNDGFVEAVENVQKMQQTQ